MFPTLATALGSFYAAGGVQPQRGGNHHPGRALAPYNVYEAVDGHVAIISIREGHWRKLCDAMECSVPDTAAFPGYRAAGTDGTPELGANTGEVLRELGGLDADEVERLRGIEAI